MAADPTRGVAARRRADSHRAYGRLHNRGRSGFAPGGEARGDRAGAGAGPRRRDPDGAAAGWRIRAAGPDAVPAAPPFDARHSADVARARAIPAASTRRAGARRRRTADPAPPWRG